MVTGRNVLVAMVVLALGGCQVVEIGALDESMDWDSFECAEDGRLGEPCLAGLGLCMREGAFVCGDDGVVCEADVPADTAELCGTGVDEDCDGEVDEAPDGRCCGDGDCESGSCVFRWVAGTEAGVALEVRRRGGRCLGAEG